MLKGDFPRSVLDQVPAWKSLPSQTSFQIFTQDYCLCKEHGSHLISQFRRREAGSCGREGSLLTQDRHALQHVCLQRHEPVFSFLTQPASCPLHPEADYIVGGRRWRRSACSGPGDPWGQRRVICQHWSDLCLIIWTHQRASSTVVISHFINSLPAKTFESEISFTLTWDQKKKKNSDWKWNGKT